MRAACYCRVSTDKDEQLESLGRQIEFFSEFVSSKGQSLYRIYADEGISGKQLKNRVQFLQMLKDAENKKFDILYVKDISRFARNTEDFLHNIRKIKNLGLNIYFITNNLNVQEGNEFFLTVLAAMAQEESARLSERIKFGKNVTAKKGRVPNFVFGYDKVDSFTLVPNANESETVRKVFDLFVNENYGTARIAGYLNDNNIATKKNKRHKWHQVVVSQILRNEIYTGKIINRKSEIIDFITGKRRSLEKESRIIIEKPELRIIPDELFKRAQELFEEKRGAFNLPQKRESVKFPLSNLIKCPECGYSFRRCQRQYSENGKIYSWWTCSSRNAKGANACSNKVNVDEETIENAIRQFLGELISNNTKAARHITDELKGLIKIYGTSAIASRKELEKELNECTRQKGKYMDMYKNEIITMDELKGFTVQLNEKIAKYRTAMDISDNAAEINIKLENITNTYMDNIETFIHMEGMDNQFLRRIIEKIIVFPDGYIKVHLRNEKHNGTLQDNPAEVMEISVDETIPYAKYGS